MFSVLSMAYMYITTFLNMPKRSFSDLEDKKKVNAWSEKNEFKPDEVSMYSHKKAIFKCYNEDCGHEFETKIYNISSGSWCPFCSRNNKICGEKSCIPCHKKSFASFHDKDKVNAWSDKNELKSHEVSISSHEKAIFKCYDEVCGHEFETKIYIISSGGWCPFCSKHNRKLCGEKSCIPCRKKSFASFKDKDKVNAWSDKNELKSHEVSLFSHKKAIFKCYKCTYEFESNIYDISRGGWCPSCYASKNKFIEKLVEFFYGMRMKYDVEVSVKCGDRLLRWDMVVYNKVREFYIESDGEQHFSVEGLIRSWRTNICKEDAQNKFEDQRKRDLLKEKYIVDNDKLLFRISHKQFNQLENLVGIMISKSDNDDKGVVKMDDIYDW